MFGRKKGTSAPPLPPAPSATETLANSPVRDRGGLSLHKPQPARPQPQPRLAQTPVRTVIPAAPRLPGIVAAAAQSDGKVLRVGPAIALSGEIAACDKLIVEGRVSAALNRCRHLEVTKTGRFSGIAEIESAEIFGRFDGELTARKVLVHASARMSGKIRYGELTLEPGAQIRGELTPLEPDVLVEEPS